MNEYIMNDQELQEDIDFELRQRETPIMRIELGPGSDVTDLSLAADVRVTMSNTALMRCFSIRTKRFVDMVFQGKWRVGHPCADYADVMTTGNPLVLVPEITGDTVVRGVLRYLQIENQYR